MNGWIKLHRKITEWGWFTEPITLQVFLYLLCKASIKATEYKGFSIEPGDCVIGRKALASQLDISERQVRTALEHLEQTGEIVKKSTNKFTVVTVVNWGLYQLDDCESANERPTNDQQATNKRPTNDQQTTTLKESKEYKEDKESKKVKKFIPPTVEEVRAYCFERGNSVSPDDFVDFYTSKGWMVGKNHMKDWKAAVRTWEKSRKSSSLSVIEDW